MKVSSNWLKDYVDIEKSPEQLAYDLSLFGHEVESVEKVGEDYVLDLEITPNRGDCLSILGIAREIAALYNSKVKMQKTKIEEGKLDKNIEVKIADPLLCPRFTARIIDNIKIGESPKWMEERLATYGFRPVNNIVDITNYVMVATGQPLHAFDYDKIQDGLMNIRQAKAGEEVITLDGKSRAVNDGAIIIEDSEKIYDLAGIMGGIKSEVDEKTKTIILQGAVFDPVTIRKTSKFLNHTTDASYRYERGVDYEGTVTGVDLAAVLIKDVNPEAKIGELIDKETKRLEDRKIELNIDSVNKLLGTDIIQDQAQGYLARLNFKVAVSSELLAVSVPSHRQYDVKIWQDVAEEIARIYGYNIIAKSPITKTSSLKENPEFNKREYIKDLLKELGFTEIYSYSFAEKDKIELVGDKIEDCIEIANPLSPETKYLRPSILPSLLSAIAKNPWAPEVNIFEIEKVFSKKFTPNEERWQLGIATTGKSDNFLKDAVVKLNIEGSIEQVDQKILASYKIRKPVQYELVDIDTIEIEPKQYSQEIGKEKYRQISRFAPTVRDLAFIVDSNVDSNEVVKTIKESDDHVLIAELFDEFTSEKFGQNRKNNAFHIWLQNINQPLSDKEIEEVVEKIINIISTKFDGKLRK